MGRDTTRTRQKAGTFMEPGAPAAGVYGPAATSSADVMVVLVMNKSARLEHVGDAAVATEAKDNSACNRRQFITSIVTISMLLRNGALKHQPQTKLYVTRRPQGG